MALPPPPPRFVLGAHMARHWRHVNPVWCLDVAPKKQLILRTVCMARWKGGGSAPAGGVNWRLKTELIEEFKMNGRGEARRELDADSCLSLPDSPAPPPPPPTLRKEPRPPGAWACTGGEGPRLPVPLGPHCSHRGSVSQPRWDVAVTEVGPSPPGPAGIDCGLVQTPASAAKLFSCPGNKNCSPRPQGICLP